MYLAPKVILRVAFIELICTWSKANQKTRINRIRNGVQTCRSKPISSIVSDVLVNKTSPSISEKLSFLSSSVELARPTDKEPNRHRSQE